MRQVMAIFDNILRCVGFLTLLVIPGIFYHSSQKTTRFETLQDNSESFGNPNIRRSLQAKAQGHPTRNRHADSRNIFIDLGTNNGLSTRFFLGMPGDGVPLDTLGGNSSSPIRAMGLSGNWEIYLFEANPKYNKELQNLKDEVIGKNKAKSFYLYNHTAIGTSDGFADFYYDNPNPEHSTVASTLMKDSSIVQGNPKEKVRSIDIVTLLRDIVKAKQTDTVVLKIDVEGSEYAIMKRLLASGAIRLVDTLAVEYHHDNKYVLGNPGTKEKYVEQFKCLSWIMEEVEAKQVDWA